MSWFPRRSARPSDGAATCRSAAPWGGPPCAPRSCRPAGGRHRLYLNLDIRRRAGVDVGDSVRVRVRADEAPRDLPVPVPLARALRSDPLARSRWDGLPPSLRKQVLAYLNYLKTDDALRRNVEKVVTKLRRGVAL